MHTLTTEQLNYAKNVLRKWIEKNRKDTPLLLDIKEKHIHRTADFVFKLKVEQEEAHLAELIALLHDIAFFVSDNQPGHVEKGMDILFDKKICKKRLIEKLIPDIKPSDDLYKIIFKAISNHGKWNVDKTDMTERESLHVDIIRDADKLDNLIYVRPGISIKKMLPHKGLRKQDLIDGKLTDKVYKSFMDRKTVDYREALTAPDWWAIWAAYVFDFALPNSVELVEKSGVVKRSLDKVRFTDKQTAERFLCMRHEVDLFFDEQLPQRERKADTEKFVTDLLNLQIHGIQ